MKQKVLIILLIFTVLLINNTFAEVFVPSGDEFIEKSVQVESKTINNIARYFGYHSDHILAYTNYGNLDHDISVVLFENFTENIICVITKSTVNHLTKDKVDDYLSKFSFNKEYDGYYVENALNSAIRNKTMTTEFFETIFKVSNIDKNGSYLATNIGYELFFANGYLSRFKSSDGYNKWARKWREENSDYFNKYIAHAEKYLSGDTNKIKNEINVQAEAYSRTPHGGRNEYAKFHVNEDGLINFKMLLVAHYDEVIDLLEFKKINLGRYEVLSDFNTPEGYKRTTYKVNKALFTFDTDGKLISSYTTQ